MYTARFMTVTCNVKEAWKDKIPAVVHVDGTARPQVVARATNPLYYDILEHYEQLTPPVHVRPGESPRTGAAPRLPHTGADACGR